MEKNHIVTRFAPSPTGFLHAGNYRTALFAYLFAKHNGGKFILRIEDTDKLRSKKEYEENIIDSLKWLGIKHDEFYRQSDRLDVYKSYINKLIDSDHAYISKETPEREGDRDEVIRFRNPNKIVKFNDLIRGEIEFNTTELGDFVIARSMDEPVFHLVVVVDDHEMGVTHIVRGEDHISNTPRHILIREALGFPEPQYSHIPIVLAPDRTKLSKRNGALPVTKYKDIGYLPDAMVNFMALIGWNPGTEQEIFTLNELIKEFDLRNIQKSGAIFNVEKLNWFNKKYIEKLPENDFKKYVESFSTEDFKGFLSKPILDLIKEKIHYFAEVPDLLSGELSFVKPLPSYDKESLMWRQEKDLKNTKEHLSSIIEILKEISGDNFTKEKTKEAIWPLAEEKGRGNVLWPMRYALSGREKSPDPFILSEILGKDETIKRLESAYESI